MDKFNDLDGHKTGELNYLADIRCSEGKKQKHSSNNSYSASSWRISAKTDEEFSADSDVFVHDRFGVKLRVERETESSIIVEFIRNGKNFSRNPSAMGVLVSETVEVFPIREESRRGWGGDGKHRESRS